MLLIVSGVIEFRVSKIDMVPHIHAFALRILVTPRPRVLVKVILVFLILLSLLCVAFFKAILLIPLVKSAVLLNIKLF